MTLGKWLIIMLMLAIQATAGEQTPATETNGVEVIMDQINQLESDRDPKCYATATRLENFMYGTPLNDGARVKKIDLQKQLIRNIWNEAAEVARRENKQQVGADLLKSVLERALPKSAQPNGDWVVTLPDGVKLALTSRDKRQYSSVAYALRALLAVQQENMLQALNLPPLTQDAVAAFKDFLDIYTLIALQLADAAARGADRYEVSADDFEKAWQRLAPPTDGQPAAAPPVAAAPAESRGTPLPKFALIKRIVEQKVASYKAYNHISMPVFVRNLQVYFARHRWPDDEKQGKIFQEWFTQAMVQFAADSMLGSEKLASRNRHDLIRVEDVATFMQTFVPHRINEYEDAIFFPNLPAAERITIESYDMDAFRDSGVHWRYLQYAIENPEFAGTLEPDPFAGELLAENIAQFGVLILRVAGQTAKEEKAERLAPSHIEKALRRIQAKIDAHAAVVPEKITTGEIVSSGNGETSTKGHFFTDVTPAVGIAVDHRSSDWLSRLLRSFLHKDKGVGNLTIPPAFGGSGVAAEDFDGDGLPDLLFLSGTGNKLYHNDRGKRFVDVTRSAGLDWRRPEDGHPGEARQPLIADFDNDGHQDILVIYVDDAHRLYRNKGDGTFTDVTADCGLGGKGLVAGPATVFDFDRDGLLDVYIGYFGDYLRSILPTLKRRNTNGLPNKLFRNVGGFRFEDVTDGSGLDNTGWTQAVSHTDFDSDGWQDLIVGNDFGVNAYYRNLGDGTFLDVSADLGTNKPSYTMNVGIADLNRDLHPDIYISNIVTMNKDEKYVMPSEDTTMKFNPKKLANMRVVEANDLFMSHTKDGKLAGYRLSDAVGRGYSSTGWSWDADFFDFDNDGDDDLYCLNGMNEYFVYSSENPYYTDPDDNAKADVHIPVSPMETNVFFVNQGGKLVNESKRSGVDLLGNSRSAAYLDYDSDGDLDIALHNYHGTAVFYRNNAEQLKGNWLKIQLVGDPAKKTNRDAIGARILAKTADGQVFWREVHGSIGYLSVHPKQQHMGLGSAKEVDVTIHWPNGETTNHPKLQANAAYTIDQNAGAKRF